MNWKILRWAFMFTGLLLTILCYFIINRSELLPASVGNISYLIPGVIGAVLLVNALFNWNKWLK